MDIGFMQLMLSDIHQIYTRYTPDIHQIYTRYTPDIHQIYTPFKLEKQKYLLEGCESGWSFSNQRLFDSF